MELEEGCRRRCLWITDTITVNVNVNVDVNIWKLLKCKIRINYTDIALKQMPINRKSLRSYNPTVKKKKIPTALKEQVWIQKCGDIFTCDCSIVWCSNQINPFNFHVGHDIPESKGGTLNISNLHPICDRCNYSMSNNYSIKKWNKLCIAL
jgi:hypothetical protein